MLWQEDLNLHFDGALNYFVKILNHKPQQDAISVGTVLGVADSAVMMLYQETVKLQNELAIPQQPFVFWASVIAPASQQALVPAAACLHVGYGNERLGQHRVSPLRFARLAPGVSRC
jgi:hypothetical protein